MPLIPQGDPSADIDPKEIEQFKTAYQLAKQFFYQEQVFDSLTVEAEKNPVKAIAGTVVSAMLRIQGEVGQMSLKIAAALGIALMDDVSNTLEEAGVIENSPELQAQMLPEAVTLWLQANNYPPQEVAAMMEEIGAPPEMTQQILQGQPAPENAGITP